jgi:sugar lactone lactonase YvrE
MANGPKIEYKADWLNFTFTSKEEYNSYMHSDNYTKHMPVGIKINSKGTIFISVPRLKEDVYSTLNVLNKDGSSKHVIQLSPFPSHKENDVDNPDGLKSVMGFEIDLDDNLWVLDMGTVAGVRVPGTAKLRKYNSKGKKIKDYPLDKYINPTYSFLNDLVIDVNNDWVYIADSSGVTPAFIVVNTKSGETRRLMEKAPSFMPDLSLWLNVNGTKVNQDKPIETGLDGIALSCSKKTIYYTPLTSRTLYAIRTEYLKDEKSNPEKHVIELGYKLSASGGLVSSRNGRLYLTSLELNSILLQADIKPNAENFQFNVFKPIINDTKLVWPDTFAFDNEKKTLWVVANQFHNFMSGNMNFTHPLNGDSNFYIWSVYVNDKSYIEDCLDNDVESEDNKFPLWAIILVVIVALVVVAIIACAIRNYILAKKKRQTFLS